MASKKGFASFSPEKMREVASLGGKTAHAKMTAHRFTSEEAREAGRKGGKIVSSNRVWMSVIGQRGGLKNRERMLVVQGPSDQAGSGYNL